MHRNGYGLFHVKEGDRWVTKWAHRHAFTLYRRELQPGETIDHLCCNPQCVNPDHLDAVSTGENSRRSPKTLQGANVRKTHCPQGHNYAESGYLDQGKRKCRICVRARNRRAHARRRDSRTSSA